MAYENLELIVDTTDKLQIAKEYLADLGSKPRLAIDTETCGKKGASLEISPALRLDSILLGISISKNRSSGLFIPYYRNPNKASIWTIEQLQDIRKWLHVLFQDPQIGWIFHNAIFDLQVLKRHISRPKNVVFDTQIAAHELNENRSIRLKDLGEEYFGADAKAEKQAMMAWAAEHPDVFGAKPSNDTVMGQLYKLPLELYGTYAIKDTMLTYGLFEQLGHEILSVGLLKRYKNKHSLIPVYEEINSTGWPIDEQILSEAGDKMFTEIAELLNSMHAALEKEIGIVENGILDKHVPITKTPTWIKRLIRKEGLEEHFTVPATKPGRKGSPPVPNPDAGKFTLSDKYKSAFLESPASKNTFTAEFLQWDGLPETLNNLSDELKGELQSMRRVAYITDRQETAKEKDKVPSSFVYNFGSDQQLQDLLFVELDLPVLKRTGKSKAPDVSEDTLVDIKTKILRDAGIDDKKPELIAEYAKGTDKDNRIVRFLTDLLKFRELEKLLGTYVHGVLKRLYSHEDLSRKPEVNPDTGHILKYCISHVSMTGTVTGRPSSSNPNQLNFPNDSRIKAAFVASTGYRICSADYDAQEVRQATNIAFDKDMKEVFTVVCETCHTPQSEEVRNVLVLDLYKKRAPEYSKTDTDDKGKPKLVKPADPSICCPVCKEYNWSEPDPHSLTAQRVYPECKGMTLKEIKKKYKETLRQNAKIVLFQTLYGGTSRALSESLRISVEDAKEVQEALFRGAPKIKQAIDREIQNAKESGYVETIGGYRRHLPDLNLEKMSYQQIPKLDQETESWQCYGKVDHHPEVGSDGKVHKMSNMACTRDGKCPFYKQCDYSFKRSMADKLRARAERQAFNVQIQGSAADITNMALRNIVQKRYELSKVNPEWKKVKIVSNIYDAIYLMGPEELCPKDPVTAPEEINLPKVLLWCMENTYPNLFVPLTAAPEKPAKSWAECH